MQSGRSGSLVPKYGKEARVQESTSYSRFTGDNLKILSFIAKHWEHAKITKESRTNHQKYEPKKKWPIIQLSKEKLLQRKKENAHTSDTEELDEIEEV